jgi:starch synthase
MNNQMNVLMTGYEIAPFYKRGGLGDVLGSLPIALQELGIDVRLVMPDYRSIKKEYPQKKIASFVIVFDKREEEVVIYQGTLPKTTVTVYFLSNRKLISVINLKKKRIEEFIFFDLAVTGFINWLEAQGEYIPDLVHCNDWHTALVPLLLQRRMRSTIKTLLTIHNLGYQGKGSFSALDQAGIEDDELKLLSRSNPVTELNALGEGILHADVISTVSPQYAKEISRVRKRTKIYHYFRMREKEHGSQALEGILNGIDENIWSPYSGRVIAHSYHAHTVTKGKAENKSVLLKKLHLPDRPTFSFIGRMAGQKGIGTILKAMEKLSQKEINVIFLGSGDKKIEKSVLAVAKAYTSCVRAEVVFSEEFAYELYAGSDFLLIPSLYEPCGLIQMVAMKYGTIPLASKTGGLMDTIEDGKTGFLSEPGSVHGLISAVERALSVFAKPDAFESMRKRCMEQDFSWTKSASAYKRLYEKLITSDS